MPANSFYRLFKEKVGIGLSLMEKVSTQSELSVRFELWRVRKNHFEIFIYIYVQNFVTSTLMGKYETICLKL